MALTAPSSFLICKHRFLYRSPISELKLPISTISLPKIPIISKGYESRRLILYVDNLKSNLWSITPQPLKDFPFQDSGVVFIQQSLLAGKKTLKQCLLVLYIYGIVSNIVFSIYRNKELVIPLGLFVGCVTTNFLTEISKELFPFLDEDDVRQHLVCSCCLFALINIISAFSPVRGNIFPLHVANGGLLQDLWLWKNYKSTEKDLKIVNTGA